METLLKPISPSARNLLYSIAYAHLERSAHQDGETLFRLLTMHEPANPTYWIGLGMCHQGAKAYEKAVQAYGMAVLLEKDNPHIHIKAAECFFALNDTKKALLALTCAKQALKLRPEAALEQQVDLLRSIWSNK